MRLITLANISRRLLTPTIVALILLALAFFGTSDASKNPENKKERTSTRVRNEQRVSEVTADELPQVSEENSGTNQDLTTTKVHVSVNSNTIDGGTTGSANVQVTKGGETQTFSKDFSGSRIRIDIDGGDDIDIEEENGTLKIDFDSDVDQDSKTKTSSSTDVDERNRVRN